MALSAKLKDLLARVFCSRDAAAELATVIDANSTGGTGTQTFLTGADGNKGVIVKANSATQTGNAYEAQDSGGTAYFKVGPPAMPGNSSFANFLNITATMAATVTSGCIAFLLQLTTNALNVGTFGYTGIFCNLMAGYTGGGNTTAIGAANAVSGATTVGARLNAASGTGCSGNLGMQSTSTGTLGFNAGVSGSARGGLSNVGVSGVSHWFAGGNDGTNVGVFGNAVNGNAGIQVGGFFGLYRSAAADPVLASAALIADNAAEAVPVFLARVAGAIKFGVQADGNIRSGMTAAATVAVGTLANKLPIYDAAGSLLGYIPIYSTIT